MNPFPIQPKQKERKTSQLGPVYAAHTDTSSIGYMLRLIPRGIKKSLSKDTCIHIGIQNIIQQDLEVLG